MLKVVGIDENQWKQSNANNLLKTACSHEKRGTILYRTRFSGQRVNIFMPLGTLRLSSHLSWGTIAEPLNEPLGVVASDQLADDLLRLLDCAKEPAPAVLHRVEACGIRGPHPIRMVGDDLMRGIAIGRSQAPPGLPRRFNTNC